jgi:hypothetical protein
MELLARCKRFLGNAPVQADNTFTKEMENYLNFLQTHLVIHYADKAANNIVFRCKNSYLADLLKELNSSVYEVASETEEEIIKRHTDFLSTRRLVGVKKLGYLYISTKFHKTGSRFVAGMSSCTTKRAARVVSDLAHTVLSTLRKKDDAFILKTGIRRFFVVRGYEEVADFLKKWKYDTSTRRVIRSLDFSTMYTSLPLLNLKDDLRKAFEEAWDFAAEELNVDVEQVLLQWSGSKNSVFTKSTARNVRPKTALTFTLEEFVELVNWLVDNTYISNGGQCRRQRQGMPMGTNYAPPICDLFLYVHESSHIDQLLLEDKIEVAKAYHLTFRLIDDVLSIDNPLYEDLVESYPSYLTAEETSLPDGANFIGMSIRSGPNNQIELGVYDKRKDFSFQGRQISQFSE